MYRKFIVFLLVVATIITILVIHDMYRTPVDMSPVFFSNWQNPSVTLM